MRELAKLNNELKKLSKKIDKLNKNVDSLNDEVRNKKNSVHKFGSIVGELNNKLHRLTDDADDFIRRTGIIAIKLEKTENTNEKEYFKGQVQNYLMEVQSMNEKINQLNVEAQIKKQKIK